MRPPIVRTLLWSLLLVTPTAAALAPGAPEPPAPGQALQMPGENGHDFVGSRACRRCHLSQFRSWEGTAHANAFELLAPGVRPEVKRKVNLNPDTDYRTNEFCLACHTVGFQRPGGFVSMTETPELVGVGCEACHGAGGAYIADDVMGKDNQAHSFEQVAAAGLRYPVPEATCRRCHGTETPFNAEIFPEYAIEYGAGVLEAATHEHRPLRYRHGPLPEGVFFQQGYDATR